MILTMPGKERGSWRSLPTLVEVSSHCLPGPEQPHLHQGYGNLEDIGDLITGSIEEIVQPDHHLHILVQGMKDVQNLLPTFFGNRYIEGIRKGDFRGMQWGRPSRGTQEFVTMMGSDAQNPICEGACLIKASQTFERCQEYFLAQVGGGF